MAQSAENEAPAKYNSQTRYIFTDADSGEVLREYAEESFTPVPDPGDPVVIADTHAVEQENGEWAVEDQVYDRMIVTYVEYEYNRVFFDQEDDVAHRLLTKVWIFGHPITPEQDQNPQ